MSTSSPYVELDRSAWLKLRAATPLPLSETELDELRGVDDPTDLAEVREVYLPLSRLLHLYVAATRQRHDAVAEFLAPGDDAGGRAPGRPVPFVIGIAGSVAVGKSTVARLLRLLLARWPDHPDVALVGTDGFLYPNRLLAERDLMERKGFPESYDRRALLRFMAELKAGAQRLAVPVYSHLEYDIVPGATQAIERPDILILEGINVLQPPAPGRLAVSDFFDFSIYVDARQADIKGWFTDRLLKLWHGAFTDPRSYFHRFTDLTETDVRGFADHTWRTINEVNLVENIEPTRGRATLILRKSPDHTVHSVSLRKP